MLDALVMHSDASVSYGTILSKVSSGFRDHRLSTSGVPFGSVRAVPALNRDLSGKLELLSLRVRTLAARACPAVDLCGRLSIIVVDLTIV